MNKLACLCLIFSISMLMMVTSAWAAPVPFFVSPGPGLDAQFSTDFEANVYGHKTFQGGSPTISGGEAELNGGDTLRYESTLENGAPTQTKMPSTSDWVLEYKFRQTGDHTANEFAFLVKNLDGPSEKVLLMRSKGGGSTDDWAIQYGGGAGGGTWTDLVTGLVLGDTLHTLTAHYKASNSRIDFYWDGALQGGGNTELTHGVYEPQFTQLQGIEANGVVSFESVVWGQIPEPASLTLLGICGIWVMLIRRRSLST